MIRWMFFAISSLTATSVVASDFDCPRTISSQGAFFDNWPDADTWHGGKDLAVMLPKNGVWPTTLRGEFNGYSLQFIVETAPPEMSLEPTRSLMDKIHSQAACADGFLVNEETNDYCAASPPNDWRPFEFAGETYYLQPLAGR